jgi:GNAT superfamily N-acetyltransferase
MIETRVFTTDAIPADLQPVLSAWEVECFPPNEYQWTPGTWRVIAYDDGVPVSHVGINYRECLLDGQPVKFTGISSVMTPEKYRRRGYAGAALDRAHTFMRAEVDAQFGQLVTRTELIAYYARWGWQHVTDPLVFLMPDGNPGTWHDVWMIWPVQGADWPGGTLDMCGYPW